MLRECGNAIRIDRLWDTFEPFVTLLFELSNPQSIPYDATSCIPNWFNRFSIVCAACKLTFGQLVIVLLYVLSSV